MITTTIRVDKELYDKLVKRASKEDRSINSQIKYIIKAYLGMISWYDIKK